MKNILKTGLTVAAFVFMATEANAASLGPTPTPAPFPDITGGTYSFVDNPFNFSISVSGPNIGNIAFFGLESAAHTFLGKYWEVTASVTADDGVVDDNISVTWAAIHKLVPDDPHSHGGAESFTGTLQRDGSEGTGTTNFSKSPIIKPHSPHKDKYNASLAATVVSTDPFDEITGWTWNIQGQHVPEPATILGLATVLGFMPLLKKGHLRTQKKAKNID